MNWENHLIKDLQWSNEIINREAKERVAREIAATAKAGAAVLTKRKVILTPIHIIWCCWPKTTMAIKI